MWLNSHAVATAAARSYGFRVDFVRFIFSLIFENKSQEKNSWLQKNFIFEGRFSYIPTA